jgi:hypothetical protein
MKSSVIGFWAVVFALFLGFILIGFFFVSSRTSSIAEVLWLISIAGIVLAVFTAIVIWLWQLYLKALKETLIMPDENGNYPITLKGTNLNLVGSANLRAWSVWQATNNRNGTPPSRLFEPIDSPIELSPSSAPPRIPAQIVDDDQAPPILIEARSMAREL